MKNDSKIPNGWAIPDDLAKKINDLVNKKPITPENELQDALVEMARDIAMIEPNPQDWGGWVNYLLEQVEGEAQRRIKHGDFDEMLRTLLSELTKRGESRKW